MFNRLQPRGWWLNTQENMKYQTASYVRTMVDALSVESGNDSLCAAVRLRRDDVDEWEVCLYSRYDIASEYFDYVLLAKAICGLVPSLTLYESRYLTSEVGGVYVDSIVIW